MIYHLITSKSIVAKIHRDLRPERSDFETDAIEWIGEALGLIGGSPVEVVKETAVELTNYVAPLPSPMTTLLAVLHAPTATPQADGESDAEFQERVLALPTQGVERAGGLQPARRNAGSCQPSYTLSPGYLQTSEETGVIVLLYKSPPVDDDGYPLVPDHPSYAQALTFYVLMKMSEGGWDHPRLSYGNLEERWLKYCTQARNQATFPDLGMLERIRDIWVRVNPDLTMFDHLFERDVHRARDAEPYGR